MMTIRPLDTIRALKDRALQRKIVDYEATRRALAAQEAWLQYADWINIGDPGAPSFLNGWSNAAIDPAWEPYSGEARHAAGYYRDRWGFVHLKGALSNPNHDTNSMFVLPADLVPAQISYFGTSYKTLMTSGAFPGVVIPFSCLVLVGPGGTVSAGAYNETTYSNVRTLLLDGIHWRAANVGPPPV